MKKIMIGFVASLVFTYGGGMKNMAEAVSPVEEIMDESAPFYIGLGLGMREIEEFDYFYGSILAGYEFSEYLGLEGRYNIGSDYNTIGGYFKAQYPTEMFTPYLLAGYAHSNYSYDDLNDNFSGFSWGGGVDIATPYENFKVYGDVVTFEGAPDNYDTEHVLTMGFKYFFN